MSKQLKCPECDSLNILNTIGHQRQCTDCCYINKEDFFILHKPADPAIMKFFKM